MKFPMKSLLLYSLDFSASAFECSVKRFFIVEILAAHSSERQVIQLSNAQGNTNCSSLSRDYNLSGCIIAVGM
jgi:hypothetical protein